MGKRIPVILVEDFERLGQKFDVVTVAAGYARNYLIPKGIAIEASERNLKWREQMLAKARAQEERMRRQARKLAEMLKSTTITIPVKVGANNKIFGSVNTLLLAKAIKDQLGVEVDRRHLELLEEVKTPGVYQARLHLPPDVDETFTFEVVAE